MSYQYIKSFRQRLKERAVYVMGEKCACCGYDKCIQALEFHHLNFEEKEFTITSSSNHSWESIKQELQKCILVCANCHREIHYGFINNSLLKSSYDEEKAQEIDKLVNDIKTHKINYCIDCGKILYDNRAKRCIECSAKKSRIIERPNREELKKMIRSTPFTHIAKKYGVSDNAIRKWCIAEHLPSKVSEIKNISDEDWISI